MDRNHLVMLAIAGNSVVCSHHHSNISTPDAWYGYVLMMAVTQHKLQWRWLPVWVHSVAMHSHQPFVSSGNDAAESDIIVRRCMYAARNLYYFIPGLTLSPSWKDAKWSHLICVKPQPTDQPRSGLSCSLQSSQVQSLRDCVSFESRPSLMQFCLSLHTVHVCADDTEDSLRVSIYWTWPLNATLTGVIGGRSSAVSLLSSQLSVQVSRIKWH